MVRQSSKRGFTLIELLISLALIATLLVTLSFVIFTFTQVWLSSSDDSFFDQHVDGVTLFLNNAIAAAEAATRPETPEAEADTEEAEAEAPAEEPPVGKALPVEWGRPPGWGRNDEPILFFRQREAPALLVRPGEDLPDLNCYLHWEEREGLSLLWFSNLQVEVEDLDDLYRTPISPYVSRIEYCYYNEEDEEWETSDEPLSDDRNREALRLPHFLRLTFTREEEEHTRLIFIPQRSEDAPTF